MSIADEVVASAEPSILPKSGKSIQRAQSAIVSLSQILGPLPDHLSSSEDPALALLHDPSIAFTVSSRLRRPSSGAGDDNLCRWFYDTFQSTEPPLQLVVLRFLPIIAGLYLSRCTAHRHHQPLAGFEAILLALYAHETLAREGNPLIVNLPNLSAPSPYHEAKATCLKSNKNVEEPIAATAVISRALEPHGTVRSTKRARIVGIALELYHSKIAQMPVKSKIEFCHVAAAWAGHYTGAEKKEGDVVLPKTEECKEEEAPLKTEERKDEAGGHAEKAERIPFPWELFLPTLRIVGHCLLGQTVGEGGEELRAAALAAARWLHERGMRDVNTQAVLATRSLMRLGMMEADTITEPSMASVYSEPSSESDPAQVGAI